MPPQRVLLEPHASLLPPTPTPHATAAPSPPPPCALCTQTPMTFVRSTPRLSSWPHQSSHSIRRAAAAAAAAPTASPPLPCPARVAAASPAPCRRCCCPRCRFCRAPALCTTQAVGCAATPPPPTHTHRPRPPTRHAPPPRLMHAPSRSQVLASLPVQRLKRSTLFVDVLSVKEFPKRLLLKRLPPQASTGWCLGGGGRGGVL